MVICFSQLLVLVFIWIAKHINSLGVSQHMPLKPIFNPNAAENVIDSRIRKVSFVIMPNDLNVILQASKFLNPYCSARISVIKTESSDKQFFLFTGKVAHKYSYYQMKQLFPRIALFHLILLKTFCISSEEKKTLKKPDRKYKLI